MSECQEALEGSIGGNELILWIGWSFSICSEHSSRTDEAFVHKATFGKAQPPLKFSFFIFQALTFYLGLEERERWCNTCNI